MIVVLLLSSLVVTTTLTNYGYNHVDVVPIVREAAERRGVDPNLLLRVAWCESRNDHNAIGRLGERGLFQLLPDGELTVFYSRGYTDPFDPYQAADFAAARFAEGYGFRWTCSRL